MFYKKLEIHNFQKIQTQIVPYFLKFIEERLEESEKKFFEKIPFNFISNEELQKIKKDIPELFECIRTTLNSEVLMMGFVYIDRVDAVPIHTDGDNSLERRIRLHWPILNEKSAATIFYEKNHENVTSQLREYKTGVIGWEYDPNDCTEVDRYILDTPTLNNVKEIHGVEVIDHKLPRILLTMRLSNDEEVYQKYF